MRREYVAMLGLESHLLWTLFPSLDTSGPKERLSMLDLASVPNLRDIALLGRPRLVAHDCFPTREDGLEQGLLIFGLDFSYGP